VHDDLLLSDSLEDSTIPIPACSPPPRCQLEVTKEDSVLIPLEVTPGPTPPKIPSIQQRSLEVTPSASILSSPEDSPSIPIPFHSSPPQSPPEHTPIDSLFGKLEVTHARSPPVYSVPQRTPEAAEQQEFLLVNTAPSIHAPRFYPARLAPSSSPHLVKFNAVFTLVTLTALVFAILATKKTHPVHTRKNEDIGNHRNGTTMLGNAFDFTQLFQLVQYTARPARLVFDPGGLVLVPLSHEDARERKPNTYSMARPLSS
jgi:hypothetical protein